MNVSARVDSRDVREIVKAWPETARQAADTTMGKYGPPNEASAGRLIWHDNGPWHRTVVYSEEVQHNFPTPHRDVLEQSIRYRVPVEKYDELAAFDGSVLVDRTRGEMAARCAGEEANFLALNLAHEIIQGGKDVPEARRVYGEAMKARKAGNPPEIMQKLTFEVPQGDTGDPDTPII